MLMQRVWTALILAAAFIAAVLYLPLDVVAAGFAVVILLGAWEWSALSGLQAPWLRGLYVFVLAVLLIALHWYCRLDKQPPRELIQPFLGVACLWWSIAVLWIKTYPGSAVLWGSVPVRMLMGYVSLALAWLAAVYLLGLHHGGYLMITLVLVAATADIGAYFAGRAFGKHKLAPVVSPAKTWEGFWGGVVCVVVLAALMWLILPRINTAHVGLAGIMTVFLAASLASVVGDLVVSMVKRESGLKDSGGLLPGHGGVMDRLDSLCAAAPVFALGLILVGW